MRCKINTTEVLHQCFSINPNLKTKYIHEKKSAQKPKREIEVKYSSVELNKYEECKKILFLNFEKCVTAYP